MNIIDFEKLQTEIEREATLEEFNVLIDMMILQDVFLESDMDVSIPVTDGLCVLKSGEIVFANQDSVRYEKALIKQKRKTNLSLVK